MDRVGRAVFVLIGIAAGGLCGCDDANQFQPPPPPSVTVQAPVRQEVTTYAEYNGRVVAHEEVDIRARVPGYLRSVEFQEGQVVQPGDLLFRIEPEPYEVAVASAKARLAQMQAALQLAEVTLQKTTTAFDRGAATNIEVVEAQAERDAAAASVQGAEAGVTNAEINLSYTEIRAPIEGRASRRLVSVGNLVGSGESTLLTTIVDDDPIYLYFNVNERDLLEYLRATPRDVRGGSGGLVCKLVLADGTEYSREGRVDFANNVVDVATGTITVRAEFPNPDGVLFPGLFGRALTPEPTVEALIIPEIAIQRDLAGSFVLIVEDDGTVARRDVTLGKRLGDSRRIVTAGLEGAEQVIVSGLQRARPGAKVVATARDASSAEGAP